MPPYKERRLENRTREGLLELCKDVPAVSATSNNASAFTVRDRKDAVAMTAGAESTEGRTCGYQVELTCGSVAILDALWVTPSS